MGHPANCACCQCSRVCTGHTDLGCSRIFYEFDGVNLVNEAWIDDTKGAAVFNHCSFAANYPNAGMSFAKHHPRYWSGTPYNGSHIWMAPNGCRLANGWSFNSNLIYDPDNVAATIMLCDRTPETYSSYESAGYNTFFTWSIRFREDGDIDCAAYTWTTSKGGTHSYHYGIYAYFYGKITPPAGYIDPATKKLTSVIEIPNTIGGIGGSFLRDAHGYNDYPLDYIDCYGFDYDYYNKLRIAGCGGSVKLYPDDSTFPTYWALNPAYPAGSISCGSMSPLGCPPGNTPPHGEPPIIVDFPPPPLPPVPPGGGETIYSFYNVYRCDNDVRTGFYIRGENINGAVFKRDGSCYYPSPPILSRKTSPGIQVFPTSWFEDCTTCEEPLDPPAPCTCPPGLPDVYSVSVNVQICCGEGSMGTLTGTITAYRAPQDDCIWYGEEWLTYNCGGSGNEEPSSVVLGLVDPGNGDPCFWGAAVESPNGTSYIVDFKKTTGNSPVGSYTNVPGANPCTLPPDLGLFTQGGSVSVS